MKKRILAVILTLAVVLSLVSITALAAGDGTENGVSATYSIGANEDGTDSYTDHATGWEAAVAASVKDGSCVKVVLSSNWNATNGTFGSGSAFHEGALYVPSGANIVLDLNGKELNRGLNAESATQYGNVIYVEGTLTVEDNSSSSETHTVTNPGYDSNAEGTSEADATITITGGLITGGYVNGGTEDLDETNIYDGIYGGAGILVYRGTLTLNSGTIAGNSVISHTAGHNGGGGVFVYGDNVGTGTFTMNGGTISYNSVAKNSAAGASTSGVGGGGVLAGTINYAKYSTVLTETAYYTTFTMNGGSIEHNVVSNGWGGGVYSGYAEVNLYAGSVSYNTNSTAGGGMCAGRSTKLTIGSSTASGSDAGFKMEYNTAGGFGGGIYLSSSTNAETTAIINSGSISNNKAKAGGGIVLNGAHVEMTGGTISNNTVTDNGGGVYLLNGTAEFTISGGEISNNTANNGGGIFTAAKAALLGNGKLSGNVATNTGYGGGGGVYVSGSAAEFTMSGGTIDGTLEEDSSYAVNASKGGGVFTASGGKFTLTGGNIINNTASSSGGGVQVNNNDSTFVMSGGTIGGENGGNTVNSTSGNVQGGGVYSNGTVTMTGGKISYNTITTSGSKTYAYGGGVHLNGGTFTMSGTAEVSNNSATTETTFAMGGGVCVTSNAVFTMDGGTVTGNNVSGQSTSYGAGVCVNNTSSNGFIMTGGTISGNGNSNGAVNGGGVGLRTTSKFTMTGGTITGNQATNGGGVYVYIDNNDKMGTFSVSGNPTITGNTNKNSSANNVYLATNTNGTMRTITLADALTSGATIGVTTATAVASDSPVQITTAETDADTSYYKDAAQYFIPDAANAIAEADSDNPYVKLSYTKETYYKVTLELENITTTDSLIQNIKSGNQYATTVIAAKGYTLPTEKPTNVDTYNISGTSASVKINSVTQDTTISLSGKANTYTVAFNANGGSGNMMPSQTMTYDQAYILTGNTYTKAGYNFAGWSTTAGGSCEHPDNASVKNLTTDNGATVTLYAVWTAKAVIPTFDSGDAAVQSSKYDGNPKSYTLTSDIEGFKITYKQGNTEIEKPTDVGTYDVVISRDEDYTYAAFTQTIADGLVITAADYPVSITADKTSMTGSGTVTLTATSTVSGITVSGVTCSDESISVVKNDDGTYSATLPNSTKTYTFTATVDGDTNNYGDGPANCTVSVTRYTSGGGSSSSSSTYTVTVDSAKNGAVTVSPKSASKGTTVTITVTPDDGYELDDLTVTDKNGDTVKLTRKSDTQYTFTMPAGKVTVSAAFKEADAESDSPSKSFADVDTSSYYYDAVEWAVENGVTNGVTAATFSPDATCTRAQMVTFLWRAAGSPAPESSVNPFADVSTSAYYYDAVLWAVEKGIANGTSATTFSPDDTVTRGQTVAFLYRAASSPASSGDSFADVASDAYYAPAVQWAVANGITNGTSSTTFSPDAPCTRGQIVAFLYRAYA